MQVTPIHKMDLLESDTTGFKNGLKADIQKFFSQASKSIPMKYVYDEEGSRICDDEEKNIYYYPKGLETSILKNHGQQIMRLMGSETPYAYVDLGCASGVKTLTLAEAAIKNNQKLEVIGIDIGMAAIEDFEKRLQNHSALKSVSQVTLISSEFQTAVSWVGKNKSAPVFYSLLGATIGNFTQQQRIDFLTHMSQNMKENDLLMIGFDKKKNPGMIQKAYFNEYENTNRMTMRGIASLNNISTKKVDLDDFWPHCYYDPTDGNMKGYAVSKIDQEISIEGGHSYSLQENEPILIVRSQRFSIKEFEQLLKTFGFEMVRLFEDEKKYWALPVFRKIGGGK